jgi:hypothetical protein
MNLPETQSPGSLRREQLEREMTRQGYKLIEVQTLRGTILIPDLK